MNRTVFRALKPGGLCVIADHAGRPGTGISESGTLHRVEEGSKPRSNFVAKETREDDHRPIVPSIWGMSVYSHQFFDQQSAGSLASAHVVLKVLFDIAPFKSVVDVGCGVAPWLRAAQELGVNYAVGLDGDYVDRKRLLVEPACFRPCDLETEDLRRVVGDDGPFDLAICMEVAEHLSARRAPAFVTELCGLSDFVLFSAAIPGQGGTNHVNEQWPEYWAAMFANNSFVCFDVLRPCLWSREKCKWWYTQNALLFAKRDTKASGIAARLGPPVASPMPLVHPRMLSGRDAGIRALEAEVGRLRTTVLEKNNEAELLSSSLESVRAELATLRSKRDRPQENAAMLASTSWRITGPLRRAVTLLRR